MYFYACWLVFIHASREAGQGINAKKPPSTTHRHTHAWNIDRPFGCNATLRDSTVHLQRNHEHWKRLTVSARISECACLLAYREGQCPTVTQRESISFGTRCNLKASSSRETVLLLYKAIASSSLNSAVGRRDGGQKAAGLATRNLVLGVSIQRPFFLCVCALLRARACACMTFGGVQKAKQKEKVNV